MEVRSWKTGFRTSDFGQNIYTMYISQIMQYLLWPALVIASWFAVQFALSYFEKKFPDKEKEV